MTGNEGLIKKVPINLEIFLLVNLGNHMMDFLLSVSTLTILVAIITFASNNLPDIGFLLATLSLIIFAYSAGMILSILNVYYRDVGYLLGVALQILFFMTPVLYTKGMLVGDRAIADLVVSLNPLSYMVEFIRDGFSGNTTNYPMVVLVLLCCILFYIFSKYIFSIYRSKIPLYL